MNLLLSFVLSNAHAKCEGYVRKASSASGKRVIQALKNTHACDPIVAKDNFFEFMKRANDLETLSSLSLTALELDPILWEAVGRIPGKISDYSMRDALTKNLGAKCSEVESLRKFLKASYVTMGDNDFGRWDDAYIDCRDKEIEDWLVGIVEKPPQKSFNDKYNTMLSILVKKKAVEALPHLEIAAIAAAENGPYGDILRATEETVATDFGGDISPENKKALEDTLLAIAQKVDTQKAKDVAFQLASSGSEDKAAQLLPTI